VAPPSLVAKCLKMNNGPYVGLEDVKAILEVKQAELDKAIKCYKDECQTNTALQSKLLRMIEAGKELKICAENQGSNLCCNCEVDKCILHERVIAFETAIKNKPLV